MDESAKSVTLSELATEIFLFALGMRNRANMAESSTLHQGVLKLFDEFEQKAKAQKIDPDDIAAAKYALAAFVDETVLSAEWPGRDQWGEDPMQLHFFGTYLAGEGFFEKLEVLRAQEKLRRGSLEVYYLCLAHGFKGKYGIVGTERLQALKKVLQSELERGQAEDQKDLSPHWRLADGPSRTADKLPRWFVYLCAAVLVACLLLYIVFFIHIRTEASKVQRGRATAALTSSVPLDR